MPGGPDMILWRSNVHSFVALAHTSYAYATWRILDDDGGRNPSIRLKKPSGYKSRLREVGVDIIKSRHYKTVFRILSWWPLQGVVNVMCKNELLERDEALAILQDFFRELQLRKGRNRQSGNHVFFAAEGRNVDGGPDSGQNRRNDNIRGCKLRK